MNRNSISIGLLKATYCDNDNLPEIIAEDLFWDLDADLNGNNGEGYLWEEAKENGCKCNLDYISKLYADKMNKDDDNENWDDYSLIEDCVKFFKHYYDNEGYNYYQLGEPCIDTNDNNGETWNIAIPYITFL